MVDNACYASYLIFLFEFDNMKKPKRCDKRDDLNFPKVFFLAVTFRFPQFKTFEIC